MIVVRDGRVVGLRRVLGFVVALGLTLCAGGVARAGEPLSSSPPDADGSLLNGDVPGVVWTEPMNADNGNGCNPGVLVCGASCCNAYPNGVCCGDTGCAPDESYCPKPKSSCALAAEPAPEHAWSPWVALGACFALVSALRRRPRSMPFHSKG
jgi:hypothetical protein